jgi:hypothetical protein
MKIPIYHFNAKCCSCKKEIDIYYPERFAYKHGLGYVRKRNSKIQSGKTIGNICPYCDSFQGNWIISERLLEVSHNSNIRNSCVWVDEDLKCSKCGADIDYEIYQEEATDIFNFYEGYWGDKCLSCMNEEDVESLVEMLHVMNRCTVCDRLIFDDQYSYDNITLDDTTIIRSKPNKHHVNYEKNEIIIVCSECHMKIHNSKKKKYKEYRPVDKRVNKKSVYLLIP